MRRDVETYAILERVNAPPGEWRAWLAVGLEFGLGIILGLAILLAIALATGTVRL